MLINQKSILFPVKIADAEYIASYSAKLTKGEEQLLITRDCRLYLTDGNGGFLEFKTINSGITLKEVQDIVDELNNRVNDKFLEVDNEISTINTNIDLITTNINRIISDVNLKFEGYVTKEEHDSKVQELKNLISQETHNNRNVLDKFSDDNGTPLYDGKKIIADFNLNSLPTFGIGGDTNG